MAVLDIGDHFLGCAHFSFSFPFLAETYPHVNVSSNVFLGLSAPFAAYTNTPLPNASWGAMLDEGRNYLTTGLWLALFPGLAILALVLGINLVGDWLRDALDPRVERGM